jgi:succinate dehydrogenase / fumarate reductase cytochrome b subunit
VHHGAGYNPGDFEKAQGMVNAKHVERPLSPHLQIYRWPVTMAVSIFHRITGAALYFGMLLLLWWFVAAAYSDRAFDMAQGIMGHWFGQLILIGFTWALMFHLLGGIRHLLWDTGHGLKLKTADALAWINIAGSIALTLLLWLAVWLR